MRCRDCAQVASVCGTVKAAGPSVRLPGESSEATRANNIKSGQLPIPAKIWKMIQQTAEKGIVA